MASPVDTIDLEKVYNQAVNTPEITQLKNELTAKKQALNTAITNINDNPWYSEATRVGRLNKLSEVANRDIVTLNDQLQEKMADANVKINLAQKQYDINNANYQNNLNRFNSLLGSGAFNGAKSSDIAEWAKATGLSTSMIKDMVKRTNTKEIKPQLITQTDNAGNVTIATVDTNTGKVISQQSLGKIGKAETPKTTKTTTPVKPEKYLSSAIKYLGDEDIALTGKGTADKLLSRAEQESAYRRILALVGNDENLARQVFQQAWDAGGFDNYGN